MVKTPSLRELMDRNHPLSPLSDRAIFTGGVFVLSIIVATLIIKFADGWTLVNSFYYIAMVTTTNGAPFQPIGAGVVLFTSLWAYFSFLLLATLVINSFGPLIGYLINAGAKYLKEAESALGESHRKRSEKP